MTKPSPYGDTARDLWLAIARIAQEDQNFKIDIAMLIDGKQYEQAARLLLQKSRQDSYIWRIATLAAAGYINEAASVMAEYNETKRAQLRAQNGH